MAVIVHRHYKDDAVLRANVAAICDTIKQCALKLSALKSTAGADAGEKQRLNKAEGMLDSTNAVLRMLL